MNLIRLRDVARAGVPGPARWSGLVEEEARTDAEGNYIFPHLGVGARHFCYSAPGKAPAIREVIVVMDGVGARLDVQLPISEDLTVRLERGNGVSEPVRVDLIPHQWWPETHSAIVGPDQDRARFVDLGGPFESGWVAIGAGDAGAQWQLAGSYDLRTSREIVIRRMPPFPSIPIVLRKAEAVGHFGSHENEAHRIFYGSLSPGALFWSSPGPKPADPAPRASATKPPDPRASVGRPKNVRGFGPSPFLPVLVEGRDGSARVVWASEASEFEVGDLSRGDYRLRALAPWGRVSFSRGLHVADVEPRFSGSLSAIIDFDEPDSRELSGFVRWESGVPAARAEVFLQNRADFRRFLKRVVTDDHGFFQFSGVPGDAPYVMYALPEDGSRAIKNFEFPAVPSNLREIWHNLTVHPHEISGTVPEGTARDRIELIRIEPAGEQVIWTFSTDPAGRFALSNVGHGRYRLAAWSGGGRSTARRSAPFEVGEGHSLAAVRWEPASH